jgi:DNA-binding MarR family transcriptional regulator
LNVQVFVATARRKSADPEPNWLSAEQLQAWKDFTLLLALLPTALEQQLQRDAQLSYVEYYVLAGLSDQPERAMRMSQLAVLANAELSRLSHLIRRLERRGLVRRETDPADGRGSVAILTDSGYAHLVAAAPGHIDRVRELVIDAISPAALSQLQATSKRIIARIESDS